MQRLKLFQGLVFNSRLFSFVARASDLTGIIMLFPNIGSPNL